MNGSVYLRKSGVVYQSVIAQVPLARLYADDQPRLGPPARWALVPIDQKKAAGPPSFSSTREVRKQYPEASDGDAATLLVC